MSLLRVDGIAAFYGATQALFDVTFDVQEGDVLALMGRNGMGKTTTIKSLCKMLPISQGSIEFAGQSIQRLTSFHVARLGVGLVPEGRRCFRSLSVIENLNVAARPGHWTMEKVTALLPRLAERRTQLASSLSGGEQQMLAIGRALMTNPRLLLLDEATEGLAPIVRQEIWQAIAVLKRDTGLAIIVVDKSLKELATVADHAVVLERGQSVWSGAIGDLTDDLINQYLGV